MSGKQKTHKGMSKRVKKTGKGKLRREKAFQSHLLKKKSTKKKQSYRKDSSFSNSDRKNVEKLLK